MGFSRGSGVLETSSFVFFCNEMDIIVRAPLCEMRNGLVIGCDGVIVTEEVQNSSVIRIFEAYDDG